MKINRLNNNISFTKNYSVIDMHLHDKSKETLGEKIIPKDILTFAKNPIVCGEDKFIVKKMFPSSIDCIFIDTQTNKPYMDEIKGNKAVLDAYRDTVAENCYLVCQPKTGSAKNIAKMIDENHGRVVGLKFHPEAHQIEASSTLFDSYLTLAEKRKLPCLFHSDRSFQTIYDGADGLKYLVQASKYSRPEQIYTLVKRHKNVPVIMGHLGGVEKVDVEAAVNITLESVKKGDAKLYADISWVSCNDDNKTILMHAIKKLKAGNSLDRFLFGTDAPLDRYSGVHGAETYQKTVTDIYNAIKKNFPDEADEIIDKIFYKNADELFFQKTWVQANNDNSKMIKKMSRTKIGLSIGAVILAFTGVMFYVLNRKRNSNVNTKNDINFAKNLNENNINFLNSNKVPNGFAQLFNSNG